MKSAIYFMLKVLAFLSRLFGYVEKRLGKKAKVDFKIYDATDWATYNHNTHCPISQEVKAIRQ